MKSPGFAILTPEQLEERDRVLLDGVAGHLRDLEARITQRLESSGVATAPLLKQKQVAARLGVSVREIQRLKSEPDFPRPVYVGSAARWRPEDLEAYLRRKRG